MPDEAGVPNPETGEIMLPPPCNLSSERLVPYGLYLIDDGQSQFIWIGRDAVPMLLLDVFGVEDKTLIKQGKTTMPLLETDFNERVRAVIDKSRDHKAKGVGSIISPSLYIIRVRYSSISSSLLICSHHYRRTETRASSSGRRRYLSKTVPTRVLACSSGWVR
jgi:hypothetical protein